MSRPTIKQQREIALKSSKRSQRLPEIPLESPELPLEPLETPLESSPETPLGLKRDKQVTVKFSHQDLARLKKIARQKHRPVANLIYSVVMDFVNQSDTDGV